MSPLVKYLCSIQNKQINRGANTDLQERINKLIRENQIRAVRNENRTYQIGAKGWWNTVNKITGRTTKSELPLVQTDFHTGCGNNMQITSHRY